MENDEYRVVFLNYYPTFYPANSGGEQRSFYCMKAIAEVAQVISITLGHPAQRAEQVILPGGILEHRIPKHQLFADWYSTLTKAGVSRRASDLATALSIGLHREYLECVAAECENATCVVVQHPALLPAVRLAVPDALKVIYLSHNCEYELSAMKLDPTKGWEYLELINRLEAGLCSRSDVVFAVSAEDRAKFIHLYGLRPDVVAVVGNGSIDRFELYKKLDFGGTILNSTIFIGSDWPPNADAAQFVLTQLAPQLPEVTFHIVGTVCASLSSESAPSNVVLHGRLDDKEVARLLATAHVGLNPMASGGGSNVKLADYFAHGLRVLSTEIGARGFPRDVPNLTITSLDSFSLALANIVQSPVSAIDRTIWREATRAIWSWPDLCGPIVEALSDAAPDVRLGNFRRICVLNEFPVRGSDNGGQARISGLYSATPEDTLVTIVTLGRDGFRVTELGPRVLSIEVPLLPEDVAKAVAANRDGYAGTMDLMLPQLAAANKGVVDTIRRLVSCADALVLEHPFMMPMVECLGVDKPIFYSSHNVESTLKAEALATHPEGEALLRQVINHERSLVARAVAVFACSSEDAEEYRRWGARSVYVLPNGTNYPGEHAGPSLDENSTCFFVDDLSQLTDAAFEEFVVRAFKPQSDNVDQSLSRIERLQRILSSQRGSGSRKYIFGVPEVENGKERPTAIFLGSGHRPNLSAAECICLDLAEACPEVDFLIVGGIGNSLGAHAKKDNVFVLGFIAHHLKTRLLEACTLGLNPMIEGGGSNLKTPDYLAHGLRVVSTIFGARGFDLGQDAGLFTADLPELASLISQVVGEDDSPEDRRKRSRAALAAYGWPVVSARFMATLKTELDEYLSGREPCVALVCDKPEQVLPGSLSIASVVTEGLRKSGTAVRVFGAAPSKPQDCAKLVSTLHRHGLLVCLSSSDTIPPTPASQNWHETFVYDAEEDFTAIDQFRCRPGPALPFQGWTDPLIAKRCYLRVRTRATLLIPNRALSAVLRGYAARETKVTIAYENGRIRRINLHRSFVLELERPSGIVTICSEPILGEAERSFPLTIEAVQTRFANCVYETDITALTGQRLVCLGFAVKSKPALFDNNGFGRTSPAVDFVGALVRASATEAYKAVVLFGMDCEAEIRREMGRTAKVPRSRLKVWAAKDAITAGVTQLLQGTEVGFARNGREQGYFVRGNAIAKKKFVLIAAANVDGVVALMANSIAEHGVVDGVIIACARNGTHCSIRSLGQKVELEQGAAWKHVVALAAQAVHVLVDDRYDSFSRLPLLCRLMGVPFSRLGIYARCDYDIHHILTSVRAIKYRLISACRRTEMQPIPQGMIGEQVFVSRLEKLVGQNANIKLLGGQAPSEEPSEDVEMV